MNPLHDYLDKVVPKEIAAAKGLYESQRSVYINEARATQARIEDGLVTALVARRLDEYVPDVLEEYRDAALGYGFYLASQSDDFELVQAACIRLIYNLVSKFVQDLPYKPDNVAYLPERYNRMRACLPERDNNVAHLAALCNYWRNKMPKEEIETDVG